MAENDAFQPDENIVAVRKTFQMGGMVLGREIDISALTQESMFEPDDTAELEAVNGSEAPDTSSPPSVSQVPPRRLTPLPIILQRPIIYSGTSAGFFEDRRVQGALAKIEKRAQTSTVPHVTIGGASLASKIITRRKRLSIPQLASEAREVAESLTDRIYGHVNGAINMRSFVTLTLDNTTTERLVRDVERFREHFGIPVDPRAQHVPHITIARAPSNTMAKKMAFGLDALIKADVEPQPKAIALGGINVLQSPVKK